MKTVNIRHGLQNLVGQDRQLVVPAVNNPRGLKSLSEGLKVWDPWDSLQIGQLVANDWSTSGSYYGLINRVPEMEVDPTCNNKA